MADDKITSVEQFVAAVREDAARWPPHQPRWFRGEYLCEQPLLPTLYRQDFADREFELLQLFRAKAPAFSGQPLPEPERLDQWLFLARHVGLPTRLLDWSEGALIGLYFALKEKEAPPVVWMLNPLRLNHLASGSPADQDPGQLREFLLPWQAPDAPRNPAAENIAGAWEKDGPGVDLPVAVHPSYVHMRLRAQRGCFTVHGKRKEGLAALVAGSSILFRYEIDPGVREAMRDELAMLGITEAVTFPDLDGLARELTERICGEAL